MPPLLQKHTTPHVCWFIKSRNCIWYILQKLNEPSHCRTALVLVYTVRATQYTPWSRYRNNMYIALVCIYEIDSLPPITYCYHQEKTIITPYSYWFTKYANLQTKYTTLQFTNKNYALKLHLFTRLRVRTTIHNANTTQHNIRCHMHSSARLRILKKNKSATIHKTHWHPAAICVHKNCKFEAHCTKRLLCKVHIRITRVFLHQTASQANNKHCNKSIAATTALCLYWFAKVQTKTNHTLQFENPKTNFNIQVIFDHIVHAKKREVYLNLCARTTLHDICSFAKPPVSNTLLVSYAAPVQGMQTHSAMEIAKSNCGTGSHHTMPSLFLNHTASHMPSNKKTEIPKIPQ